MAILKGILLVEFLKKDLESLEQLKMLQFIIIEYKKYFKLSWEDQKMGLLFKSLLFISSLVIIGLGIFLLKHKNLQENVANYIKIVGSLCVFLGVSGIFVIVSLIF